MKLNNFILNFFILLLLLISCNKGKDLDPGITIVKYKNPEYNNYVSLAMRDSIIVGMPADSSRMVDTSGKYCVQLHQEYFLGECCWYNEYGVLLNIKKNDWPEVFWMMDSDSLWRNDWTQYILDEDPFLEIWREGSRNFGIWDSTRINEIIDNGEMEKYFGRIK